MVIWILLLPSVMKVDGQICSVPNSCNKPVSSWQMLEFISILFRQIQEWLDGLVGRETDRLIDDKGNILNLMESETESHVYITHDKANEPLQSPLWSEIREEYNATRLILIWWMQLPKTHENSPLQADDVSHGKWNWINGYVLLKSRQACLGSYQKLDKGH